MRWIVKLGRGVILYFPEREANGAGLVAKIKMNARTGDAKCSLNNVATILKTAPKAKKLEMVKQILEELEIDAPIHLLTNNPQKVLSLKKAGIEIDSVVHFKISELNLSQAGRRELKCKRRILGHWTP